MYLKCLFNYNDNDKTDGRKCYSVMITQTCMCSVSVKFNYIYKYDFSNLNVGILLQIIQASFHSFFAVGCCETKLKWYLLHPI